MTYSDKIFQQERLKSQRRFIRQEPHQFKDLPWKGDQKKIRTELCFWIILFFAVTLIGSYFIGEIS